MAFKRPPSGRDSAPGRSSNRTNKSDDRPKRPASKGKSSGSDKTDWNKPPKKESASERPGERRRTAGSRPGASKSEGGEFKSSFTGGEKKAYAPRKPYSGRPSDGGDDRKAPGRSKPYSGRVSSADSGSDRPKRSFGGDEGGEKKHTQHHAINHIQAGLVHQTTNLKEVLAAMRQAIKNHSLLHAKNLTQEDQQEIVRAAKEKQVQKAKDQASVNSRQNLQPAVLSRNVKAQQANLSANHQNRHTIK